jgi:hypothetical protein
LRAGDLRLRCVAAAGSLRHVVGTVMLGSSLGRDRNHEYGEGKGDGFHNDLSRLHSHIERANRCLDPSGTSIQAAGSFGSVGNVAASLAFALHGRDERHR